MAITINGTTGITDVNGTAAAPAITGTDTDSGMYFGTNTVSLATNGTAAVSIDASQNVTITGTATATKLIPTGTSVTGNGMYLPAADTVAFSTAGSERARFDSSGNLRVGTTAGIVGVEKTSINAGSSGGYGLCVSTSTTGGYSTLLLRNNDGNATNIQVYFVYGVSTTVGSITTTSSATAYNTSSDYRLKENIAPMTGALATVSLLKPVTYKWKIDSSNGQGFIAHELAEVVPDCVTGEKDAVDSDGNIKPQGIDTSFLIATLTAAIQEQQALITSLTDRIAALEAQ